MKNTTKIAMKVAVFVASQPVLDSGRYVGKYRHMEIREAVEALGALAQETRLAAFRLLVEAGAAGLPAGDIARELTVPHNTMSTHLAILARAGLIKSRRESRQVIYAADYPGMRSLIAFLVQDCCRGREEVCASILAAVQAPTSQQCSPAKA